MLTVAIDAGHPSKEGDAGAMSACGKVVEVDYTIHIARLLLRHLECTGEDLHVHMIRTRNDEVLSIPDRALKANLVDADLVLSIHVDSAPHSGYSGGHTIHWPDNREGAAVASLIAASFPPVLRCRKSPALEALWPRAHYVVSTYLMTAVLVECGYASNTDNVAALVEPVVQDQIVGALAQGVRLFRQLREARWLG